MATKEQPGEKVVATNRRARRDYEILETVEAGLVLRGSEVKALREAKVTLGDAYARIKGGEAWVVALHITPYSHLASQEEIDPERDRKLLLHRREIERLGERLDQEALTLVPLQLYFKSGRAKLEIALARGKRHYDRRQEIAKRDADLEARRAMSRARRR